MGTPPRPPSPACRLRRRAGGQGGNMVFVVAFWLPASSTIQTSWMGSLCRCRTVELRLIGLAEGLKGAEDRRAGACRGGTAQADRQFAGHADAAEFLD